MSAHLAEAVASWTSGLKSETPGLWVATVQEQVSFPVENQDNIREVEDKSFWFAHRNQCLLAVMKHFPPALPLVDIGGGNGYVARGLQTAGLDTVLLEPGPDGAKHARERGVAQVICATFDQAGFAPSSLPAVGLFDVVEHIEDDAGFLRKLYTAMKPGARAYFTVPAHGWLWSGHDAYAGHYRRYNLAQMNHLLTSTGFQPLFSSYYFAILTPPQFLFRALPFRLKLEKPIEGDNAGEAHEQSGDSLVMKIIQRGLSWEIGRLQAGKSIPQGASCLVVAEKSL